MKQRLNFIGCGQLGKTLGSLWYNTDALIIGQVLTRSMTSAQSAVSNIGAGEAIDNIADMHLAQLYLIACGDDDISDCSQQLARTDLLREGDVVFHCSGAQTSNLLAACKLKGASVASIHPIKSFANLDLAIASFAGTYCGMEGDDEALSILTPLFTNIGANLLPIRVEHKTLYHTASVIASNYLVALQELSINTFEKAGISRPEAMAVLQPIVSGTVDNIFRLGTSDALTGPIARGDNKIVSAQLAAMQEWDEDLATLYRILGKLSVPLAMANGNAKTEDLESIQRLLDQR